MIRNLLLAGLLGWSALGFAAEGDAGEATDEGGMTVEEFLTSLDFRAGVVNLPDGIARIDLGDGFRYLSPEDAERVLVAWGNPPGNETQGMLVPTGSNLFDEAGWAVIISYEEDGYVSDEDADSVDYAGLLRDMQADTEAENEGRVQAGYEPIRLVGWAAPPHYDGATHKLYWAKELAFGDAGEHTLNYNIRVLGRKGVLLLNAVAGMSQLAPVKTGMQQVLAITEFNEGHRYADFDPDVDQVAAYGIGALVAGKLAAKVGLLAKLGVLLVAMKKFIVLIVIAAVGLVARLFRRKPAQA